MAKKEKPLISQHRRFVAAYRRLRVAWRAYAEVYPRASAATAETEGPALLRNPRIASEIVMLDTDVLKAQHMSADEVLALAANRARADIGDLFWKPGELDSAGNTVAPERVGTRKMLHELPAEVRRCIQAVELDASNGRNSGTVLKVKLLDPTPHETNIMKHHKLLSDNLNVNITLGFSERLRAAREKRLKGDA